MFSIGEIKDLIKTFDESTLTRLEINGENGCGFKLERKFKTAPRQNAAAAEALYPPESVLPSPQSEAAEQQEDSYDENDVISSPMVGVFYEAPSPDSAPFVTVGQRVSKGETVCIIEAMKLMNEIAAEKSGVITEVCVDNGDIVEFGQPLFRLK